METLNAFFLAEKVIRLLKGWRYSVKKTNFDENLLLKTLVLIENLTLEKYAL